MSWSVEKCKKFLRSILLSDKGGLIPINILAKDFKEGTGDSIPYRSFGFSSLETFLQSIPDVCRIVTRGREVMVEGVATKETKHIKELVQNQKGRGGGGGRGGRGNRSGGDGGRSRREATSFEVINRVICNTLQLNGSRHRVINPRRGQPTEVRGQSSRDSNGPEKHNGGRNGKNHENRKGGGGFRPNNFYNCRPYSKENGVSNDHPPCQSQRVQTDSSNGIEVVTPRLSSRVPPKSAAKAVELNNNIPKKSSLPSRSRTSKKLASKSLPVTNEPTKIWSARVRRILGNVSNGEVHLKSHIEEAHAFQWKENLPNNWADTLIAEEVIYADDGDDVLDPYILRVPKIEG